MKHQRGVALLLVLWVLALLSVLLAGLAGWVQLENRQALWQRQHTQALMAAEAGLSLAVMGLSDPAQRRQWVADGRVQGLSFDTAQLRVSVRSERGKLDLNAASADDFGRLLQGCGAPKALAQALGQALDQRRGNGQAPLRMVEEVRQLPGLSQPLYRCVEPQVTLWSGLERPDPGFATRLLKRLLSLPNATAMGADPGQIVSVRSVATLPNGAGATLRVTLLLNPSTEGARPYRVLHWQE
ncbi:type II secretion system protein GspK [Pseudomonas abieticivorans]|uniref:type II secretion system protein GspK n=1 Tax=Pseudomonas abieticivorans TaxID=2931382 RepID=UPI0020C10C84|nr:type II secretion system protein GspK [Pseudomonas sp. PIA16]